MLACSSPEELALPENPPEFTAEELELLTPRGKPRVSVAPAEWTSQGVLGRVTLPEARPERWHVSGPRYRFDALVVRGKGPAIVVLPHLDGTSRLAEYIARRAAHEGYQVISILPARNALPLQARPRHLVAVLAERVRAGRVALALAGSTLEAPCVAVIGTSLGGMAAVPVSALEPHVAATVILLGGADLEWIATHTAEKRIAELRWGELSADDRSKLQPLATLVDPLSWGSRIPTREVLLLRARWDRVVPWAAGDALWRVLGRPESHTYWTGHYSFAAMLPQAITRSLRHAHTPCPADADVSQTDP